MKQFKDFDAIDHAVAKLIEPYQANISTIYQQNFLKILNAFKYAGVASHQLSPSYGYGLSDSGIQAIERVFAFIFKAESALVRPQLSTGTQALFLILKTLLNKGDKLLSLCDHPYETLQACIGIQPQDITNHLIHKGIIYEMMNIIDNENDLKQQKQDPQVKVIWIQKSCGYSQRRTISNQEISKWMPTLRAMYPNAIVAVDNCYGEWVEEIEPIEAGADICAGSLLKNPGGGLAKTGAYLAGKKELVHACADELIAPGMGFETTPNLGYTDNILQGLFISPLIVKEALHGMLYLSCFMELMGYEVCPRYCDPLYDIVLKIAMKNKTQWQWMADTVQAVSPIDSFVTPVAFEHKGYSAPIIMAGGTFVPGSSIEFSVDGFATPPYHMYYQAGMMAEQSRYLAKTLFND